MNSTLAELPVAVGVKLNLGLITSIKKNKKNK